MGHSQEGARESQQRENTTVNDIVFDCPKCGETIQVDSAAAGQSGSCPYCKNAITVPVPQRPDSAQAQNQRIQPLAVPPPTPSARPAVQPIRSAARKTNGLAIAGLILGILSVVLSCLGFLLGLSGVICSSKAISQINKNPTEQEGKGLAIAGLSTSIVGLTLGTVVIAIALFSMFFTAVSFAAFGAMLESLSGNDLH